MATGLTFTYQLLQARNETTYKKLAEDCSGIYGTLAQAIDELGVPRLKTTRPVPSYKGVLTLGNPDDFDDAMCIEVERYPRTMIRKPVTASSFVQRTDSVRENPAAGASGKPHLNAYGEADDSTPDINPLEAVRTTRTYEVEDENAPGGKREVDQSDLARGYEYGRTAVHIAESDLSVTKLETKAGLEIVGFIPWDSVCYLPQ